MAQTANVVQLKPRTLQAFEAYIRDTESCYGTLTAWRAAIPVV